MDSIVLPFVNITLTASIASNCESQIVVGTSFRAAVKRCIACVILYFYVMRSCFRYSYKYSEVSVMINALVLLSIA